MKLMIYSDMTFSSRKRFLSSVYLFGAVTLSIFMNNYALFRQQKALRSEATKESRKLAGFDILGLLRFARNDGGLHIYSVSLLNVTALL